MSPEKQSMLQQFIASQRGSPALGDGPPMGPPPGMMGPPPGYPEQEEPEGDEYGPPGMGPPMGPPPGGEDMGIPTSLPGVDPALLAQLNAIISQIQAQQAAAQGGGGVGVEPQQGPGLVIPQPPQSM